MLDFYLIDNKIVMAPRGMEHTIGLEVVLMIVVPHVHHEVLSHGLFCFNGKAKSHTTIFGSDSKSTL